MVFVYPRRVLLADTDAAGVMYFSRGLEICHEAYEASLMLADIDLKAFFRGAVIALPVTHASIDYSRPSHCGDRLQVHLRPTLVSETEFKIDYTVCGPDEHVRGQAKTRHVCIGALKRQRVPIRSDLQSWLERFDTDEIQVFG